MERQLDVAGRAVRRKQLAHPSLQSRRMLEDRGTRSSRWVLATYFRGEAEGAGELPGEGQRVRSA